MSAPHETLRLRTYRLLAEITQIGSPRHCDMAAKIFRQLADGHRMTRTTAGVVEAIWRETINHAALVRQIKAAPPHQTIRSIYWKHEQLFVDDWKIDELRPGNPVTRLLAADGWSA
ncbi:MAG: hypothetical protein JO001_09325 [Alphaproteobacteria bacterium]|nr:hypothetical protein [Alphaproteobacteria bacterium]